MSGGDEIGGAQVRREPHPPTGEAHREGEAPAEPAPGVSPPPSPALPIAPASHTPSSVAVRSGAFHSRKHPAHGVIETRGHPTIVFLTVCTKQRRRVLATPEIHALLVAAWRDATAWVTGRYTIMPDHVHLFVAPSAEPLLLENWVRFWKSQFAKRSGMRNLWQPDHWDTRLRSHESYSEKWEYVLQNPVRHGLVKEAGQWPYSGELFPLPW